MVHESGKGRWEISPSWVEEMIVGYSLYIVKSTIEPDLSILAAINGAGSLDYYFFEGGLNSEASTPCLFIRS
jgi:hypothetical protein